MKKVTGNLIGLAQLNAFDVIVHGCNCMCTMGAGVALAVRQAFPSAYAADLATEPGSRAKLGTYTSAQVAVADSSLVVVNAYTQFDWRGRAQRSTTSR